MHRIIRLLHAIFPLGQGSKRMMTFLLALDIASFTQESCRCVKSVFYEFVKLPKIPEVKSKLYAHANMFGIIIVLVEL